MFEVVVSWGPYPESTIRRSLLHAGLLIVEIVMCGKRDKIQRKSLETTIMVPCRSEVRKVACSWSIRLQGKTRRVEPKNRGSNDVVTCKRSKLSRLEPTRAACNSAVQSQHE